MYIERASKNDTSQSDYCFVKLCGGGQKERDISKPKKISQLHNHAQFDHSRKSLGGREAFLSKVNMGVKYVMSDSA